MAPSVKINIKIFNATDGLINQITVLTLSKFFIICIVLPVLCGSEMLVAIYNAYINLSYK